MNSTLITLAVLLSLTLVLVAGCMPATPAAEEAPAFVLKWGGEVTEGVKWFNPRGVAVDYLDNIYVTDGNNNCIKKFNGSGQLITQWDSSKGSTSRFWSSFLNKISIDRFGTIYVTGAGIDSSVHKFSNSGNFIISWGSRGNLDSQFYDAQGMAFDSWNNIYIADAANHRIQIFDSSGKYITKWGSEGNGDGQFNYPCDLAIDSSDNIYVSDTYNRRIQKFSSSGDFITKWGTLGSGKGQFSLPLGIAIDTKGYVNVCDLGNFCIQKFNTTGEFIARWGSEGTGNGQFKGPSDITFDSKGYIYVLDNQLHNVQKFDPNPKASITDKYGPWFVWTVIATLLGLIIAVSFLLIKRSTHHSR